jgi:hypothetical protein
MRDVQDTFSKYNIIRIFMLPTFYDSCFYFFGNLEL